MLAVGPDFYKTLRIPVLEGRAFTSADFVQAAQAAAAGQSPQQTASSLRRVIGGEISRPGGSADPRACECQLCSQLF